LDLLETPIVVKQSASPLPANGAGASARLHRAKLRNCRLSGPEVQKISL